MAAEEETGVPDPELGNIRYGLQFSTFLGQVLTAIHLAPTLKGDDAINQMTEHGYFKAGCYKLLFLLDGMKGIPDDFRQYVRAYNTKYRLKNGPSSLETTLAESVREHLPPVRETDADIEWPFFAFLKVFHEESKTWYRPDVLDSELVLSSGKEVQGLWILQHTAEGYYFYCNELFVEAKEDGTLTANSCASPFQLHLKHAVYEIEFGAAKFWNVIDRSLKLDKLAHRFTMTRTRVDKVLGDMSMKASDLEEVYWRTHSIDSAIVNIRTGSIYVFAIAVDDMASFLGGDHQSAFCALPQDMTVDALRLVVQGFIGHIAISFSTERKWHFHATAAVWEDFKLELARAKILVSAEPKLAALRVEVAVDHARANLRRVKAAGLEKNHAAALHDLAIQLAKQGDAASQSEALACANEALSIYQKVTDACDQQLVELQASQNNATLTLCSFFAEITTLRSKYEAKEADYERQKLQHEKLLEELQTSFQMQMRTALRDLRDKLNSQHQAHLQALEDELKVLRTKLLTQAQVWKTDTTKSTDSGNFCHIDDASIEAE